MLRIIRIALVVLVPTVAIASIAAGCGDDTSTPQPAVIAMPPPEHDLAMPHDMAMHD